MARRVSPALIGLFVVGAVVLAVVGVVLFGSGRFFRNTADFIVFFTGTVNGLKTGAPVKFKGVEIGSVKSIMLRLPGEGGSAGHTIPVVIELDAGRISASGGRQDFHDRRVVDSLIERGLRAQLSVESLVTGVLYVALDLYPETPATLLNRPDSQYQEIPAVPTTMEQVQSAAQELFEALRKINIQGLVDSANEMLKSVNELAKSPEVRRVLADLGPMTENLNETLTSFRRLADNLDRSVGSAQKSLRETSRSAESALSAAQSTLEAAKNVLEPGSPFAYQLAKTLEDVGAAARAIEALAQYLERNPSALVRGRELPEERK